MKRDAASTRRGGRNPLTSTPPPRQQASPPNASSIRGLHLFEDLAVTEVVDGDNQPVPPGVPGEKVLVTVLFGRTQPLIRYEMSDSITSSDRVHCPCGRPYPLIEGVQGRVEEALEISWTFYRAASPVPGRRCRGGPRPRPRPGGFAPAAHSPDPVLVVQGAAPHPHPDRVGASPNLGRIRQDDLVVAAALIAETPGEAERRIEAGNHIPGHRWTSPGRTARLRPTLTRVAWC